MTTNKTRKTNVKKHPRKLKKGRTTVKRHDREIAIKKADYREAFNRKSQRSQTMDRKRTSKNTKTDDGALIVKTRSKASKEVITERQVSRMDWAGVDTKPSKKTEFRVDTVYTMGQSFWDWFSNNQNHLEDDEITLSESFLEKFQAGLIDEITAEEWESPANYLEVYEDIMSQSLQNTDISLKQFNEWKAIYNDLKQSEIKAIESTNRDYKKYYLKRYGDLPREVVNRRDLKIGDLVQYGTDKHEVGRVVSLQIDAVSQGSFAGVVMADNGSLKSIHVPKGYSHKIIKIDDSTVPLDRKVETKWRGTGTTKHYGELQIGDYVRLPKGWYLPPHITGTGKTDFLRDGSRENFEGVVIGSTRSMDHTKNKIKVWDVRDNRIAYIREFTKDFDGKNEAFPLQISVVKEGLDTRSYQNLIKS